MSQRMPAVFVGHGSPMNALDRNRYTEAWRAFGEAVPTPRAILVVSAHWYINATAVTAMSAPRTIHDFYGFPRALFEFEYAAPGLPDLADEIADLVQPTWVGRDEDSWGLDHGTWSVLCHMFPDADVPVVQLAINAEKPFDYHVQLGAALHAMREDGILVVGSGNVVHNLGGTDFNLPDDGFDWARRFNEEAKQIMATQPGDLASMQGHADFRNAVPTPDHFIPALYIAGLAAAAGVTTDVLVDGYAYGSLSMTSFTVDAPSIAAFDGATAPVEVELPPLDETNI